MSKCIRQIGIGFDHGAGNQAISIFENGKSTPVISPLDGEQTPTLAYAKKDGVWHFGREAIMQSIDGFDGQLIMNAKRFFLESPDKKMFGDFTPKDVITQHIENGKRLLLMTRPTLADYPQFGSNKRPADELGIVFSIPSNWRLEPQTHYGEAIENAGITNIDGFIAEPIAAARRLAHQANIRLRDGQTIAVVDCGTSTTDVAVLRYHQGVYDQLCPASGDAYLAGLDYAMALAPDFAKQFRISWKNVSHSGGLVLDNLSPKQRALVLPCFLAADEAKVKLSLLDEVTVAVNLPKGRKTMTISRARALELWKPLHARMRDCVRASLDDSDLSFADVDYVFLVGGSAPLPGLREAVAEAVDRDVSDVLVSTDSAHVVAAGAGEHAYFQDESSQSLEGGLGMEVVDADSGEKLNLLLVAPGQIVPPEGLFLEHQGFEIRHTNGTRQLLCRPTVCKTGVRASVVGERNTFLSDTEVVSLRPVRADLNGFPTGDHPVAIGVKIDPNRKLRLLVRPTKLMEVEPVSIPLVLERGEIESEEHTGGLDILLLLDCSGSMAVHGKIEQLRNASSEFVHRCVKHSAELAVVSFFAKGTGMYEPWRDFLVHDFTDDEERLLQFIVALTATGGTPMAGALELGWNMLKERSRDASQVVVLFTDGLPGEGPAPCIEVASHIKDSARLITVGVGPDTNETLLIQMASNPGDYFPVNDASGISLAFERVTELILRQADQTPTAMTIEDLNQSSQTPNEYDIDWDQDVVSEEVA